VLLPSNELMGLLCPSTDHPLLLLGYLCSAVLE
jgi:hypothetical protein